MAEKIRYVALFDYINEFKIENENIVNFLGEVGMKWVEYKTDNNSDLDLVDFLKTKCYLYTDYDDDIDNELQYDDTTDTWYYKWSDEDVEDIVGYFLSI